MNCLTNVTKCSLIKREFVWEAHLISMITFWHLLPPPSTLWDRSMFGISRNPGYLANTFINARVCSDKCAHFRWLAYLEMHEHTHTHTLNKPGCSTFTAHYVYMHIHTNLSGCINRKRTGRDAAGLFLMFLKWSGSLTLTSRDSVVIPYAIAAVRDPIRQILQDNQNKINFPLLCCDHNRLALSCR